jgi:hypothetical protein
MATRNPGIHEKKTQRRRRIILTLSEELQFALRESALIGQTSTSAIAEYWLRKGIGLPCVESTVKK